MKIILSCLQLLVGAAELQQFYSYYSNGRHQSKVHSRESEINARLRNQTGRLDARLFIFLSKLSTHA